MKRFKIALISAVMALSFASCAENSTEEAEDIKATVTSKTTTSVVIKTEPDSNGGDKGGDGSDILTPPTTVTEDLLKSKASDFEFKGRSENYDAAKKTRYYYDGTVTDDNLKEQIFAALCNMLKNSEFTPKDNQSITGGGSEIIALNTSKTKRYVLCDAILCEHPEEEGGDSIYILKTPDHQYHYLAPEYADRQALENLIARGLQTEENLVRIVSPDPPAPHTPDPIADEIAFVKIYSNYAWVNTLKGSCVDKAGNVYEFDFSDAKHTASDIPYKDWLLDLICVHMKIAKPVNTVDKDTIARAYAFAEKVDPNAETTRESVMCDYGQNTLYAVVNGSLTELCSQGDVDVTVHDENAQQALKILKGKE